MADLNQLYSDHQLSLMRARSATSRLDRTRHLAFAGLFAHRIRTFQLASGAGAAMGWLRHIDEPGRSAGTCGGLCA